MQTMKADYAAVIEYDGPLDEQSTENILAALPGSVVTRRGHMTLVSVPLTADGAIAVAGAAVQAACEVERHVGFDGDRLTVEELTD